MLWCLKRTYPVVCPCLWITFSNKIECLQALILIIQKTGTSSVKYICFCSNSCNLKIRQKKSGNGIHMKWLFNFSGKDGVPSSQVKVLGKRTSSNHSQGIIMTIYVLKKGNFYTKTIVEQQFSGCSLYSPVIKLE